MGFEFLGPIRAPWRFLLPSMKCAMRNSASRSRVRLALAAIVLVVVGTPAVLAVRWSRVDPLAESLRDLIAPVSARELARSPAVDSLRAEFNRAAESVRIVAILSPT